MSQPADVSFKEFVDTFNKLESTTSRNQMTLILANFFKKVPPQIIDKAVYLMQARLWPDWKGLPELGVAERSIVKAMSMAFSTGEGEIEELLRKLGDLGKVAEQLKARRASQQKGTLLSFVQSRTGLTLNRVYETLARIAMAQGEGSKDIKVRLLSGILAEASPEEARFIIRLVEGRLRVGVGDATIMDALATAFGGSSASRPVIERAYNLRADLGEVAKIVAEKGVEALKDIKPELGVPVRPMLAERHNDPKEILDKAGGSAFVEYKYDGERAQIHKRGDEVIIFSRRLENITHQYPDVVEAVRRYVRAKEAIVEGEIVAFNPETGEFMPFQELMHRKRKHDIHEVAKEIPVKTFLFDLLYLDGEDFTVKPLPERRKALEGVVEESDKIQVAEYIFTKDPKELEEFFLKAIEDGAEGVMVKAVHDNSIYQAGVRGWLWIKFKRDYRSEMTDTVDLVVVGAFYGKGKRGGKIGTLLMAAYNPDNDTFETVCKVGTGFTDEDLEKMADLLRPYMRADRHPRVVSKIEPDVWVEPALVAEIIGAELTLSPLHTCALGVVRPGAGISIRFPRFIRWRSDKSPTEATTSSELVEMYKSQLRKVSEKPAE
ncbi:MAG: ATP-dependent DNA ligase [Desulfurococcaceae archaeon]